MKQAEHQKLYRKPNVTAQSFKRAARSEQSSARVCHQTQKQLHSPMGRSPEPPANQQTSSETDGKNHAAAPKVSTTRAQQKKETLKREGGEREEFYTLRRRRKHVSKEEVYWSVFIQEAQYNSFPSLKDDKNILLPYFVILILSCFLHLSQISHAFM